MAKLISILEDNVVSVWGGLHGALRFRGITHRHFYEVRRLYGLVIAV